MFYHHGVETAIANFGLSKLAVYLRIDDDASPGARGQRPHIAELFKSEKSRNPVGEIGYDVHPEGHAEVNWFFMEPEHTGKGHGQAALRQVLEKHKAVLSDTSGGTTESAQRAFQRMLAKFPDVEVRDLKARDLGGDYTDIDGNRTSIWYAKLKDAPGLSDKDLDNIVHNSMYHRRRRDRVFTGAFTGGALGGLAGALIPNPAWSGFGSTAGVMAGTIAGGMLTNVLQKKWDEKRNLRGNW